MTIENMVQLNKLLQEYKEQFDAGSIIDKSALVVQQQIARDIKKEAK